MKKCQRCKAVYVQGRICYSCRLKEQGISESTGTFDLSDQTCSHCGNKLGIVYNFNTKYHLLKCVKEGCPKWFTPQGSIKRYNTAQERAYVSSGVSFGGWTQRRREGNQETW